MTLVCVPTLRNGLYEGHCRWVISNSQINDERQLFCECGISVIGLYVNTDLSYCHCSGRQWNIWVAWVTGVGDWRWISEGWSPTHFWPEGCYTFHLALWCLISCFSGLNPTVIHSHPRRTVSLSQKTEWNLPPEVLSKLYLVNNRDS